MRLLAWDGIVAGLAAWECNSPLWRLVDREGPCLALLGNTVEDHEHGKVLLFGDADWTDYAIEAEMRVTKGRMPNPLTTWFGYALRAQDPYNYECFFLKPHTSGPAGVAYVAVAHGLQPVWTEGYARQQFGVATVPFDVWTHVRAEVQGRQARIFVEGKEAMQKTLTYYLQRGRPGLYVGTLTDVLFRNVNVDTI